jgi:hypothetical protein
MARPAKAHRPIVHGPGKSRVLNKRNLRGKIS